MKTFEGLSADMATCIDNCNTCYTACVICIREHAGEKMMADCIKACLDCIGTTRTSAHLMSTGSPLHHQACGLCADACERCYNTCKEMDNPFCQQCAEACKQCMESCRAMAA